MAKFFSGLLPFFALLWSLNLLLFYRTLYTVYFDIHAPVKMIVPFAMVAITGLLIILPIGPIINRCVKNEGEEINKLTYQQCFMKFPTDYDRENPVTKNEGFLRVLD